jgi:CheY-like chemotaxis protein
MLATPRAIQGRHVLLVSDGVFGREALRRQLEFWGVSAATVSSATDALAACQAAPYDAVIIDLQKGADAGPSAVRAIRAGVQQPGMRLVLVTSRGESVARATADGADGYLARPVRPTQLHDCLANLLLGDVVPVPVTPTSAPNSRSNGPGVDDGVRLLVAEDNVVNQRVIGRMLEKLGYQVDLVADGREAIDALLCQPYAAVLMDCQMPGMDGFEATGLIRDFEQGKGRTPIIALTASVMQGDREQCLAAGMDDYIAKPVLLADLAATLDRWIAGRAAGGANTASDHRVAVRD